MGALALINVIENSIISDFNKDFGMPLIRIVARKLIS